MSSTANLQQGILDIYRWDDLSIIHKCNKVSNDKPCNEEQRLQQRDELTGSQHHSNKRRRTFSSNMSQFDKGYFESYSHLVSPLPLRVVFLLRLSLSTEPYTFCFFQGHTRRHDKRLCSNRSVWILENDLFDLKRHDLDHLVVMVLMMLMTESRCLSKRDHVELRVLQRQGCDGRGLWHWYPVSLLRRSGCKARLPSIC